MERMRRATPGDAPACGRICYEAFAAISTAHGFPPDFPSGEVAAGLLGMLIGHSGFYNVVAERAGAIIGSNFLDERSVISGVGPITVDPAAQNAGVGRRLMQDVLERAASRGAAGVRLTQAGFHRRSLCLYTTLGFRTREPLAVMNGPPLNRRLAGFDVRPVETPDLAACNALCVDVHGFDRGRELQDAVAQGTATLVERGGRVTGYATEIGFFAHSVARSNADLIALISAATTISGPGFLLPTRNHELFSWALGNGLRLVQPMTLMSLGLYNEPAGAYLPGVLY